MHNVDFVAEGICQSTSGAWRKVGMGIDGVAVRKIGRMAGGLGFAVDNKMLAVVPFTCFVYHGNTRHLMKLKNQPISANCTCQLAGTFAS